MKTKSHITPDYALFVADLKSRIVTARLSASRAVNRELILLYWDIGHAIVEKQKELGWGESVIDQISQDLRAAFPGIAGFSHRNLQDMKRFFLAYADELMWRQLVAKIAAAPASSGLEIWDNLPPNWKPEEWWNFCGMLSRKSPGGNIC